MTRRMSFPEAAETVKLGLDILDVIGRYMALKRAGKNYVGLCPFHPEKSPSFYVTPHKQMFKCFGCGEGGDTLSFLMKRENKTYGELIAELADDQGIDIIREGRPQQDKTELDLLLHLHTLSRTFYETQLQQTPEVQAYLTERQIPAQWQAHFGLGFAPPGWENLMTHLRQQAPELQQQPQLLEKAGLANIRSETSGYYDRFRNRLMIPVLDDRGRVVAFGARALVAEDNPKYLNSPETVLYVKNRVLYGYFQAKDPIRSAKYAVLMEGYFDVIAAHMAGISQAVGVCGTALTEQHVKLLQRAGAETLYLCFDSDTAGITAALRAIELVQTQVLDNQLILKVITLPGEKDPDDFLKHNGKEAFEACMAQAEDFLRFKFRQALAKVGNLHSPEGRIHAVQAVCPLLLQIQQPVIRQEYVKQLAELIGIAEETLALELKRLERQNPTYGDKKNYFNDAIFSSPARYKEKKPWEKKNPPRRPEDTTAFRRVLSPKLPLEEKEHRLLSYLFVNAESYELVMPIMETLQFQSPLASALLAAVQALVGQWDSVASLATLLQARFHVEEKPEQLRLLAQCSVVAEEIQEGLDHAGKGLKSSDNREKLKREVADIVNKIQYLRKQDNLSHLVHNVRQQQEQSDDAGALALQIQLSEALKARRNNKNKTPEASLSAHSHIVLENEQGV